MSTKIRCVKPEFYRHMGLFQLEQRTRLPVRISFEGLWAVADREGRFRWRAHEIKLDVLPYDEVDFAVILEELTRAKFIVHYVVDGRPKVNHWRATSQIPATSPESEAFSKDLKRRGFSFVGPTVMYAYMQSAGLVNDHLVECFRYQELMSEVAHAD